MAHLKTLAAALLGRVHDLLVPLVTRLAPFGRANLPLLPAYEYVQADALARLPEYLRKTAAEIGTVVIVGAWHGEEVAEMLDRFPRCRLILLEPSNEAYAELTRRWGAHPRVTCLQVAAGDEDGTATFHEMSITGNGSLLPLAAGGEGSFRVEGIEEKNAYEVRVVRLDGIEALRDARIDCLWIDVQGFEMQVLAGASGLLHRVGSAFIEVTTGLVSYEGGARFPAVTEVMDRAGFRLATLGTDPVNGQGNALYVRG